MRAPSSPITNSDSLPLSLRTSPKRCRRSSTMLDLRELAISCRFCNHFSELRRKTLVQFYWRKKALSFHTFLGAYLRLVFARVNVADSFFDFFPNLGLVDQEPFMPIQMRVELFYPQ